MRNASQQAMCARASIALLGLAFKMRIPRRGAGFGRCLVQHCSRSTVSSGGNPNIRCHIDAIYVHLKARSDDRIPRERPSKKKAADGLRRRCGAGLPRGGPPVPSRRLCAIASNTHAPALSHALAGANTRLRGWFVRLAASPPSGLARAFRGAECVCADPERPRRYSPSRT
jgi:hypothetical protein